MTDVTAPLFRAFDRGIVVASLYAATLIACAELNGLSDAGGDLRTACWIVCGVVAGAIPGFSNTHASESLRADVRRNACDGAMVVLLTTNLVLAVNVTSQLDRLEDLAVLLAWFAGATLLGALLGELLLAGIAMLSIREWRPFSWASETTEAIANDDVRFVARVLLHTLVVAVLLGIVAAVAIIAFYVILIALALAAAVFLLKAVLTPQKPKKKSWWS